MGLLQHREEAPETTMNWLKEENARNERTIDLNKFKQVFGSNFQFSLTVNSIPLKCKWRHINLCKHFYYNTVLSPRLRSLALTCHLEKEENRTMEWRRHKALALVAQWRITRVLGFGSVCCPCGLRVRHLLGGVRKTFRLSILPVFLLDFPLPFKHL